MKRIFFLVLIFNFQFSIFNLNAQTEKEALDFLYSYMSLPDSLNYSKTYWQNQVRVSLEAKKQMPWGRKVSKQLWEHFVLPVRVNNENLDQSRETFYKELAPRLKGLTMTQAALEINHWCHEKVTYTPSDARTSAPSATVRSAYGRCGEESTFTVAAMRAMCIPARQVYTPRWAHTDDNHAWVEVWVDGKWHFLGACEPEAVLDLGWFNAPASRGMMMHTNVFGNYQGKEEVMKKSKCYTRINVTENYAPVVKTLVKVVDGQGRPVEGATVDYKLYNYGELYTIVRKSTDKQGEIRLSTGKGDLIVWASKDGLFGFSKYSVGKDKEVTVKLDKDASYRGEVDFDLVPPVERNTVPYQTAEQIARNKQRFAKEDSIRQAYMATFHTEGNEFVKASRGNWKSIEKFLKNHPDGKAEALLSVVSAKDLRDTPDSVLEDHYLNTRPYIAGDEDAKYYLNPRIGNELLTPYRKTLSSAPELQQFKGNAEGLAQWIKDNIRIVNDRNPLALRINPVRVYESRMSDNGSRDYFYVAAARSLGMQARIDEVTGKLQYLKDGKWHEVVFDSKESKESKEGVLKASYTMAAHNDDPQYYYHWTLSKLVDGRLELQNYPEEGYGWKTMLRDGTEMDAGTYLMCSGTRMASGAVLVHLNFVGIELGKTTETVLKMRENKNGVQVIGSFNSEDIYNDDLAGRKSLLSTTGRGYYVIGLISPNEEPTNHALKDIALKKDELEKWGKRIVLLFKDKEEEARFTNKSDFHNLPSTVVWGTDVDGKIAQEIKTNMKLSTDNRPVFLICDTFNRVVFCQQGYTIGLGEQLLSVIKQL